MVESFRFFIEPELSYGIKLTKKSTKINYFLVPFSVIKSPDAQLIF